MFQLSKSDPDLNSRALKMLHESLVEAQVIVEKSLNISTTKSETSDKMADLLEQYSKELSAQVYELFKQKLDKDA